MAKVNNPWISYITRSYQQIKASLIQGLVSKVPEMTDHSESNILIILISMVAGVAEMLGYYIDNMAREAFIGTARRYSSMVKGVKILDYRIKASNPATVDITIAFSLPVPLQGGGTPYQLPTLIEVEDSTGVKFISQNTVGIDIPPGSSDITLPFIQQGSILNQLLGTSDGSTQNQKFAIPSGYVDMSMALVIGGIPYNLKETAAYSFPLSKDYTIEISEDGIAYVVLGDGVNGNIPINGAQLLASFKTTLGSNGNLAAQTITTLNTSLTPYLPVGTTATVSNLNPSTGGAGYEGIEDIRKKAPLSIRTLSRAVTAKDYEDICILYPGVSKAKTNWNCGNNRDIFIVPINGGLASSGLLSAISTYLDEYKTVGTFPVIRPAGTTNMVMTFDVTLKFRADPVASSAEILTVIKSFFALDNQEINGEVHESILESKIQSLSAVDFLNIPQLTTRPYARPVVNPLLLITQPELNWSPVINPACSVKSNWTVTYLYDPVSYPFGLFVISRNGLSDGNVVPNTLYNSPSGDMQITFNTLSVNDYASGQQWDFTTYPYNQDLTITDFSILAVRLDSAGNMPDITLNIIQQLNP